MLAMAGAFGRAACVAALLLHAPAAARAEAPAEGPARGPYISVGGGFSHLERSSDEGSGLRFRRSHDLGPAAFGAAGYSFGHFRLEGEVSYRGNEGDGVRRARELRQGASDAYAFMANGYVEPFPDWRLSPYIGAGLGGAVLVQDGARFSRGGEEVRVTERSDAEFAYQAIAGARMSLGRDWSVRADYRYLATLDPELAVRRTSATGSERGRIESDYRSHALMVGVSYHLGRDEMAPREDARQRLARDLAIRGHDRAAQKVLEDEGGEPSPGPSPGPARIEPPAAPAPLPRPAGRGEAPAPAPAPARAEQGRPYVVFFGFDSAALSNEAIRTIERAAGEYRNRGVTRLLVDGHADRAGPDWYNEDLAIRRARAVAGELVARGVRSDEISVRGFGEREPRIPTADGVRSESNRRAEIHFRG